METIGLRTDGESCPMALRTMPRTTGLELAAEIGRRRPGLPVVLYTGYAEGLPDGGVDEAGVRAVARKPIEPAELRSAIVPLLARAG